MTKQTGLPRREGKSTELVEICSVRVDQGFYGIPIQHILEIIGTVRPQHVPLAPSFVGGLVHYRGDVLTTVSLRQLLGIQVLNKPQAILVLENPSGCFGLLVDAVEEVITIPASDHEPNPPTLHESTRLFFAGSYRFSDRLLVMLDPEQLDPSRLVHVQAT